MMITLYLNMIKNNVSKDIIDEINKYLKYYICFRLVTKGLFDEKLNYKKSNFIRFGYTDRKDKEKKYLDTKRGKILEKYSLEYLTDCKFKDKLERKLK